MKHSIILLTDSMQFSQRQGISKLSPSPINDGLTEVISESSCSQAPQSEVAIVPRSREVDNLFVLGIPLHKTSPLFQLVFSVTGVMIFYLLYGYVQVNEHFIRGCFNIAFLIRNGYFTLMVLSHMDGILLWYNLAVIPYLV